MAVFIAAAVLIASTSVDAAPRKVKLGVSSTEGRNDITVLDEFRNETGYRPAIWTLWSAWGNQNTKLFPKEMVKKLKARKTVPMIFWEPVQRQGVCTDHARFKKIKNGKFDKYIKNWARAAKLSKTTILLRFAHEINGKYFPWTIGSCGNTVTDYKAAWKRVHNIFKNKVKAKNVKFVWTVAKQVAGGKNPYKRFYPGNQYVQFVGFSTFNWGAAGNWTPMANGVGPVMKWLKKFTKKPVVIAELGTNGFGGPTGTPATDKPKWIREGYVATYNKFPQIKAIVYLNEDLRGVGHPDWSLDHLVPQSMDAYEWVLNKKKNGKYIFRGRFR